MSLAVVAMGADPGGGRPVGGLSRGRPEATTLAQLQLTTNSYSELTPVAMRARAWIVRTRRAGRSSSTTR